MVRGERSTLSRARSVQIRMGSLPPEFAEHPSSAGISFSLSSWFAARVSGFRMNRSVDGLTCGLSKDSDGTQHDPDSHPPIQDPSSGPRVLTPATYSDRSPTARVRLKQKTPRRYPGALHWRVPLDAMRLFAGVLSPQHLEDLLYQALAVKRLGQKSVDSQFDGIGDIFSRRICSQDQDRDRTAVRVRANLACDPKSVYPRHIKIRNDQVRR